MDRISSTRRMPSECSFSDSELSECDSTATINMILKRAEEVHKQCMNKRTEWAQQLKSAESETHQAVHEEFSKAISYLQLWEDQFNKEVYEAYSEQRMIVEKILGDIQTLQDSLSKSMFTTMGRLRAAAEGKDLPFQEASNMLGITGKVFEKIRSVDVLPRITFRKTENCFTEAARLRFGYLATLDVLPHQLSLHHPIDVIFGTMVFVIQVPHTKFKLHVAELLESTLEIEGEGIQQLKSLLHDNNLEITLEISKQKNHTIGVQLYHQHICGSPFVFSPTMYQPLKLKREVDDKSSEALENFIFSSDSSSLEDYAPAGSKYDRVHKMAPSGLNMVNRFLNQALKDNLKQEEKKLKAQMALSTYPDQVKKKTSQKESVVQEKVNVNGGCDANNNDSIFIKKKESSTDGNIADDEGEYDDRGRGVVIPAVKETTVKPVGDLQNRIATMNLQDEENNVSNHVKIKQELGTDEVEEENFIVYEDGKTPKVARKSFGFSRPLRRPRIPAALTDVPGTYVYGDKCPGIKTEDEALDVNNAVQFGKTECRLKHIKEEDALTNASNTINADAVEMAKVFPQKSKTFCEVGGISYGSKIEDWSYKLKSDVLSASSMYCFAGGPSCHRKIMGVCTERQDDWKNARLDPKFNDMMSKLDKLGEDQTTHKPDNHIPLNENCLKVEGSIAEQDKVLKVPKPKLSAKMIYKSLGPSSDPLLRPIGVAELADGSAVVADTFNDRLALFNEDGKFVKYFRTQNMSRPSAVVVLNDGKYAVKDSHSITIFSAKGGFENTITTGLKKPFGLTLNGDGDLMTVQTTLLGYVVLLTINPESGKVVKQMKVELCHPDEAKRLMSKPRFISYHKEGRILIVDLGLNCIFVVDIKSGDLLFVFGESGGRAGQFSDPSGIACDSDGYILIGDSRNHRVQVFDPDGQFVCILHTDTKLCRPSGICLTSLGNLYVLNYWDNSLAKYGIIN